jgi:hypothetical protein
MASRFSVAYNIASKLKHSRYLKVIEKWQAMILFQ